MDASTVLKTMFEVLHYSGVTKLFSPLFQGVGAIFCLHHVLPDGGRKSAFSPNYQLEVSTRFLEETIRLCKYRGLQLVSLEDACQRIVTRNEDQTPFAVFTLDDGYRDNADHAAPVFRKYDCPYTIFVAPRIAEGTCELWWRVLELVLKKNASIEVILDGKNLAIDTSSDTAKSAAWSRIMPIVKNMDEHAQREWISNFAHHYGFDIENYCRSVAMSWSEIAQLNRDPLCTIAAHTLNHYAVKRLPADDALREMRESKRQIEKHLGEECKFFAYPYGDEVAAGPRDFKLAAEAGFKASVTTRKGVIFEGHDQHLQALPRIMLSGRYQEQRYVDALISGVPFALLNRFRRINVS